MELKKYRWAKTYEAGESELVTFLESRGIEAERWAGEENEAYATHVYDYDKRLWCADGSIAFLVNGTTRFALQAGDGLSIPANTTHEAVAGFAGCVCFESHSAKK